MKAIQLAVFSLLVYSGLSFAGGSIGGGGGSVSESLELATALESLPKTYIGNDDFRRVKARLSVSETQSTPAVVEGETVDLKAFRDSIVDVKFSKEILPSD